MPKNEKPEDDDLDDELDEEGDDSTEYDDRPEDEDEESEEGSHSEPDGDEGDEEEDEESKKLAKAVSPEVMEHIQQMVGGNSNPMHKLRAVVPGIFGQESGRGGVVDWSDLGGTGELRKKYDAMTPEQTKELLHLGEPTHSVSDGVIKDGVLHLQTKNRKDGSTQWHRIIRNGQKFTAEPVDGLEKSMSAADLMSPEQVKDLFKEVLVELLTPMAKAIDSRFDAQKIEIGTIQKSITDQFETISKALEDGKAIQKAVDTTTVVPSGRATATVAEVADREGEVAAAGAADADAVSALLEKAFALDDKGILVKGLSEVAHLANRRIKPSQALIETLRESVEAHEKAQL